jgi:hypothetical protein
MTKRSDSRKSLLRKHGIRSGLELKVKNDLDEKGVKYGYEDTKFRYGKVLCKHCGEWTKYGTYTPDFTLYNARHTIYVESKGYFPSPKRTLFLAVLRDNPSVDFRLLFQVDCRIRKGSDTFYSDWADKHDIEYAIGETIPENWYR